MSSSKISAYSGAMVDPERLKDYLGMLKPHLCLYISLSAIAGYVLAAGVFTVQALWVGGSVLILAQGSAVLNNIQDREFDLWFHRTHNRPLPQSRIPLGHAAILSAALITVGLIGLFWVFSWPCFFSAVMAVIMYNGLYTPLKKTSLLAILPGAFSGMLPVLIGWTAFSPQVMDKGLWVMMTVLGLWQVPHFFIILLKQVKKTDIGESNNRFPSFIRFFGCEGLRLQTVIWTSLYSLGIFWFLISGGVFHPWLGMVCAVNAIIILVPVLLLHLLPKQLPAGLAFAAINISMLTFLAAQILDKSII